MHIWRMSASIKLCLQHMDAIFRRHAENPTWRIEKQPHLANMQGQYVVYGQAGQVLRRGRDLQQVLRVFDRKRFTIVK